MTILDYVVLAEYARVDPAGLRTLVSSFDRVQLGPGGGRPTDTWQIYVTLHIVFDATEIK